MEQVELDMYSVAEPHIWYVQFPGQPPPEWGRVHDLLMIPVIQICVRRQPFPCDPWDRKIERWKERGEHTKVNIYLRSLACWLPPFWRVAVMRLMNIKKAPWDGRRLDNGTEFGWFCINKQGRDKPYKAGGGNVAAERGRLDIDGPVVPVGTDWWAWVD